MNNKLQSKTILEKKQIFIDKMIPLIENFSDEIEKLRHNELKKTHQSVGIIFVLTLVFFLWCYFNSTAANASTITRIIEISEIVGGSILVAVASEIIFYFMELYRKEFSYDMKKSIMGEKVMENLFSEFGKFHWDKHNKLIPTEVINDTGLIHVDSDNFFRGDDDTYSVTYNGLQISIDEVNFAKKGTVDRTSAQTVFDGIVFDFELNKNTDSHILIVNRHRIFLKPRGYSEIKLESVEFSKKYKVYATDEVEARYMLNTLFIDRFMDLRVAFNIDKLECSIKDSHLVFVAGKGLLGSNVFEIGNLYTSYKDINTYSKFFDELSSILAFSDVLNLESKTKL
jgi:hypothetical protein